MYFTAFFMGWYQCWERQAINLSADNIHIPLIKTYPLCLCAFAELKAFQFK